MRNPAELIQPEQLLDEMKVTDSRIEELRGYRRQMLDQVVSSEGFKRLLHNLNFILSEKQIARHLRIQKIHRDRVGQHYKIAAGEEPPTPAWRVEKDKPEKETNARGSARDSNGR
jgi:hypothetical protein